MQLYSVQKQMSQAIDGHAAAFARLKLEGYDTTLFIFASLSAEGSKLHIIEIGHESKPQGAPLFEKRSVDIYYPPEATGDFPVALKVRKLPSEAKCTMRSMPSFEVFFLPLPASLVASLHDGVGGQRWLFCRCFHGKKEHEPRARGIFGFE